MTQTNQMMSATIAQTAIGPLVVTQIARPMPAAGQVLVRIHASGVNPLDLKIHAGEASTHTSRFPPFLELIWPAQSKK